VRLRFEGAPFDQLMSLLGELENSYGMSPSNASFDSVGPGLVNSSLVLTRNGN
jgi:type II secretory pathway component PulM